jgi:hypothetical protein
MIATPAAAQLAYLINDFTVYAPQCLKIQNKKGEIVPLVLNRAQLYMHAKCEDMLRRKGYVRIVVLKGRQQGLSTYTCARYYWKGATEYGKRIFIMTHHDDATTNLFNMVKRYNDNVPEIVRPHTKFDNAKELYFDRIDTRYSVATAGSKAAGRSATAQYFLGSEVAFWQNAEAHMAGIGQIIPLQEGTEIILESTGNGLGNLFHSTVVDAISGKSDYELVFIPWYWEDGYRRDVPDGFSFDGEDLDYMHAYGLDLQQLYWRRRKIDTDFKGDVTLFDQEYPALPELAFLAGTSKALISPMKVSLAMKNSEVAPSRIEPVILGVDPAEYGDDDTGLIIRWGRRVVHIEKMSKAGNEQVAGRVAMLIDKWKPDAVNIDVTGIGTGVEAFLTSAGYGRIVNRVHFGEQAIESLKYVNRGAECWGRMQEWLHDAKQPPSLPGNVQLALELSSRNFHYNASRKMQLESKEEMARRGVRSPNLADALALTFAVSVSPAPRPGVETLEQKLARLRADTVGNGGSPGMGA